MAVVGVAAGAWQALDSKAGRTAARIEAKLDAAVREMREEMREERRQAQEELRAHREELREDRQIWLQQFDRVDERLDDLDRRVSASGR